MTGGELITEILQRHGVGTVFALGGASHTHLLDPLERNGVHIVSSRHEGGAVGAADGYARMSGKPGVALIIADQGLPNAIGALAVAWHALSPVVVLVATPPRVYVEADGALDQDQLALVTTLTKWARTVPEISRLPDYLETAIKHANSGRRGPVVLLIPQNLLQEESDVTEALSYPEPAPTSVDPALIEQIAERLLAAKRPLIVAGSGVAWANASEPLRKLAKKTGIPVFMNGPARGAVAEDHETGFSWPYAQPAAKEADCVLILGARTTQRLGLGLPPRFDARAFFIQVDIATEAFHRNRPTDLPVHGDIAQVLRALNQHLDDRQGLEPKGRGWLKSALASRRQRISEILESNYSKVHPLQLADAIDRHMPVPAFVGDGADINAWMYGAVRIKNPRSFMDHYPMGAMGSGTSLAVGAAAWARESGETDKPVVLVTGDGSFGFYPMELHAAVAAGLNLVVIIGNDGAWGTELHGQQEAIGRTINTELGALAYEHFAAVIGGTGFRIEHPDEMEETLSRVFTTSGVVIVNAILDVEAGQELKNNPDVSMILFSDILSGQADLSRLSGAMEDEIGERQ